MTATNTSNGPQKKQQAQALLQQNRLAEAEALYTELCKSDKTDAEAHYMLGVINGKLGKFGEAADCFRQVTSIQPQAAMAYFGLGSSLKAQNKLAEAADSLRQAVRIKPDMVGAYFDLGSVLYSLGKLDEAKESFLRVARLKPMAEAYHCLGNIYSAKGMLQEAATYYQQALKLNPSLPDTHNKLGYTLYSLGLLDEAAESHRQAIRLKPDFTEAHNNLGRVLTVLGNIEESLSCYQEALRINPDSVDAAFGIVNAYEWTGEFQKASERLEPLIEQHPGHVGVVQVFARLCKLQGRCREAIDLLQKALQQHNLAPVKKRQLHFSLGKLYDALESYDAAFGHYQSANSIQAPPYDPAKHARDVDALISTFSADSLHSLPRASHISERPVFILGMPRSGTSLVEQILASHPQVFGAGELRNIGNIVARMAPLLDTQLGFPGCVHKLTGNIANTLAREYLGALDTMSPDALRVTDKMPHNFMHLGIINLLFPGARVIHCTRHPLDTSLSIYFQYFNASHAYAYSLEQIGTHYREYEKLMAHWRQVIDIPMLEVSYEELVTRPDEMIPQLVEFCGLEWDPACLRFYEKKRFVNTASYDQVRQPLHPKSIGRWKHYENHLGALKSALGI